MRNYSTNLFRGGRVGEFDPLSGLDPLVERVDVKRKDVSAGEQDCLKAGYSPYSCRQRVACLEDVDHV